MDKFKCERCGAEQPRSEAVLSAKDGEYVNMICKHCSTQYGTCYTCVLGKICPFETDPDPMPKFFIIEERAQHENGYSIVQRQVPNTERLRKFCLGGKCPCCNETDPKDPFCCKFTQYSTCTNYCEEEYRKIVENFSMQEAGEN